MSAALRLVKSSTGNHDGQLPPIATSYRCAAAAWASRTIKHTAAPKTRQRLPHRIHAAVDHLATPRRRAPGSPSPLHLQRAPAGFYRWLASEVGNDALLRGRLAATTGLARRYHHRMPVDLVVERHVETSDTDLPDTLYHYTDINGLRGMWEDGEIWATNSSFLNDTSELRLGATVIQAHIAKGQLELTERLLEIERREASQGEAGEDIDAELRSEQRASLTAELAELEELESAIEYVERMDGYIACLTERDDQLSQWRGYARDGYCVGFDTKKLIASLDDNFVIRRVRYHADDTAEEYANRVLDIARAYRNAMLSTPDTDEEFRRFVVGKQVMLAASFLKDSNFAEEREVRIVTVNGTPNLFTPHRYGMVPRIKIPLPTGAIASVRVGPSTHEKLKALSLLNYFHHVGFRKSPTDGSAKPSITRSRIPFRDY